MRFIASRRHVPRELQGAWRLALKQDWQVWVLSNGHLQWRHPDGKTLVVTSHGHDGHLDGRGTDNALARLSGAGLCLKEVLQL